MSHISPIRQRVRIHFGKAGTLQYTGNLDTAKIWERVLRRADLPILYSRGFNTRPRLQLASALPLGITSECEILDVMLREPIELSGLVERLLAVSPEGLKIYRVQDVPPDGPALQTLVRSATYRIHFDDERVDRERLTQTVDSLLSADNLIKVTRKRGRKGKIKKSTTDLRPLILDLQVDTDGDLIAHLAVGDHGNLRPDQLLEEAGLGDTYFSIHRLQLHLDDTP